jgi:hypothetical protein
LFSLQARSSIETAAPAPTAAPLNLKMVDLSTGKYAGNPTFIASHIQATNRFLAWVAAALFCIGGLITALLGFGKLTTNPPPESEDFDGKY